MIPEALKELHEQFGKLQKYVHSGGKPVPSRAEVMYAQTGQKTVSYVEEARILEDKIPKRVRRAGPYQQNMASAVKKRAIAKLYKHEPGFPDLLKVRSFDGSYYPAIAAASGKIDNEMLSGVSVFRSFGPEGITHGIPVGSTNPGGVYWGIGRPPISVEKWRGPWAVQSQRHALHNPLPGPRKGPRMRQYRFRTIQQKDFWAVPRGRGSSGSDRA
jgi:hypothetical protein